MIRIRVSLLQMAAIASLLASGCASPPVIDAGADERVPCATDTRFLSDEGWVRNEPSGPVVEIPFATNLYFSQTRAGPVEADGRLVLEMNEPLAPNWTDLRFQVALRADTTSASAALDASVRLEELWLDALFPILVGESPVLGNASIAADSRLGDPMFAQGNVTLSSRGFLGTGVAGAGALYAYSEPGTDMVTKITASYCAGADEVQAAQDAGQGAARRAGHGLSEETAAAAGLS